MTDPAHRRADRIEIIRQSELRAQPWKNGTGITREIAAAHLDGALLWRVSLADVTSDGPFSVFPEMARILTVVQGYGMDLQGPSQRLAAAPLTPLRFDGNTPLHGTLRDGPVVNFNLIYDAARLTATVATLKGPYPVHANAICIFHALAGTTTLGPSQQLDPGDTAILSAFHAMEPVHTTGTCIAVTLRDQREASSPFIAAR